MPTGSTIYASNIQSELPSDTVLGVCEDSLQLAVPQSVISATNCVPFEDSVEFTEDFQIRYYGMWDSKASGVLMQISGKYIHDARHEKTDLFD